MSCWRRAIRRLSRHPGRGEEGSALIEFVGVSLALLLPLIYLLLSVFAVQKAAFAVTQAAREAGRTFATAASSAAGMAQANRAASLALADQGVAAPAAVRFAPEGTSCGHSTADGAQSLTPGARFVVCVRSQASLPFGPHLTVNGQYTVAVDAFRQARS